MPRNKFTTDLSGGTSVNVLVSLEQVGKAGGTILATEYNKNWSAVADNSWYPGKFVSKAHRPISPFNSRMGGYSSPYCGGSGFYYKSQMNYPGCDEFGLLNFADITSGKYQYLINGSNGNEANAVGRHHISKFDSVMGGPANFLFGDGHVMPMPVRDTFVQKLWGNKYYSIRTAGNGGNSVLDY